MSSVCQKISVNFISIKGMESALFFILHTERESTVRTVDEIFCPFINFLVSNTNCMFKEARLLTSDEEHQF